MARWVMVALVVFVTAKCLFAPGKHSIYPEYVQAGQDFWAEEPESFVACQYLPFFSLGMTPLVQLPARVGELVWALGTLAVYLTGLWAFFRSCVRPTLEGCCPHTSWLVFLVCSLAVGLSSLANQQANVLLVGLLLWGTYAVRERHWWLAAACLGLAMFKAYPLALGLVFAVLYPRQLLPRLAVVAAVLLAAPFAALPPAAAWERYVWILEYVRDGMHSLRFQLVGVREWLGQYGVELSQEEFFPVQAATGLIIPILLLLSSRDEAGLERRGFVLTSLWFVTFGPSVEGPTYLLVAPALGWLLLRAWRRQAWTAFGFVLGVVLLCGPAQTSLFGREIQQWLARTRPACLVLLMALAWQMAAAGRGLLRREQTQETGLPVAEG
jgi:hypothetical protein